MNPSIQVSCFTVYIITSDQYMCVKIENNSKLNINNNIF